MARIRTIKPDYWTDDKVGECSVSARLLFIATWNFADDHGGLDRSAKQLQAQAFPYDQVECEPLIQELLRARLMVEYEVDGKKYLHIKNFGRHQKIEKKSSPRHPVYKEFDTPLHILPDSSVSSAVSSLEGNGREWKGSQNVLAGKTPPTRKTIRKVSRETDPEWMLDFRLAYPKRSGDQKWRSAIRAAKQRIAEGHSTDEFVAGAQRYAAYCDAAGKTGTEFVKQAATFLGPEKSFLLPWHPPPRLENASEQILRKLRESDDRVIEHESEIFPAITHQ